MRFQIGQKYKIFQVSSASIVSNNILIIYMTLLKKTLHLALFMDNSYLTLKEALETKEK